MIVRVPNIAYIKNRRNHLKKVVKNSSINQGKAIERSKPSFRKKIKTMVMLIKNKIVRSKKKVRVLKTMTLKVRVKVNKMKMLNQQKKRKKKKINQKKALKNIKNTILILTPEMLKKF